MWSSSAEKGKPQRKQPREGGRAPEAPQKSPPRLKTRFPHLCVHLCVGLPHRESCKLCAGSQSTFSRPGPDLLPEELQGRGLPGDLQSQFWGWCPLDLISTAPVRPPTGRILDDIRQSVYDLGHRANFDSATTSAIMQLSAVTQTPATMQFSSLRPPLAKGCEDAAKTELEQMDDQEDEQAGTRK